MGPLQTRRKDHKLNSYILCQTIQNMFYCDNIFDLDLLLYGSPDPGFNTNTQIFEAVHT